MSYSALIAAHQRLEILSALEQDPDYSHNEFILQSILRHRGHSLSTDTMRVHLRWLEEQGLVKIDESSGVLVAALTRRGEDVALGHSRVPGIARPRPED